MHDLTVLIEEAGAYPTAVLCRIERFLADLRFAAARSMCRMYRSGKTILITAIHAARISFSRQTVCRLKLSQHFFLQFDVRSYPLSGYPKRSPKGNSAHTRLFPAMRRFFRSVWRPCSTRSRTFFLCTESVANFCQVSPDICGVYKSENVHLYSPLYRYSIQRICRISSCFFLA